MYDPLDSPPNTGLFLSIPHHAQPHGFVWFSKVHRAHDHASVVFCFFFGRTSPSPDCRLDVVDEDEDEEDEDADKDDEDIEVKARDETLRLLEEAFPPRSDLDDDSENRRNAAARAASAALGRLLLKSWKLSGRTLASSDCRLDVVDEDEDDDDDEDEEDEDADKDDEDVEVTARDETLRLLEEAFPFRSDLDDDSLNRRNAAARAASAALPRLLLKSWRLISNAASRSASSSYPETPDEATARVGEWRRDRPEDPEEDVEEDAARDRRRRPREDDEREDEELEAFGAGPHRSDKIGIHVNNSSTRRLNAI